MTTRLFATLLPASLLALSATAEAATITVDTFDDVTGGTACSLRSAVAAAEADAAVDGCTAGSGFDTIQLSAGTYAVESRIALTEITGFEVAGAGPTETILEGLGRDESSFLFGDVTRVRVELRDLTARRFGGSIGVIGRLGGTGASMRLERVVLTEIDGNFGGAAVNAGPGSLFVAIDVVVDDVRSTSNGAPLSVDRGRAELTRVTIRNSSGPQAGAFFVQRRTQSQLRMVDCLLENNDSPVAGAIFSGNGPGGGGVVNLINTTIAGNRGASVLDFDGSTRLAHVTLAGNTATGPSVLRSRDELSMVNSLVAGNDATGPLCDVTGSLALDRNNVFSDADDCAEDFADPSNRFEPLLTPVLLADLEGTRVLPVTRLDPTFAAGDCTDTEGNAVLTDQAGRTRIDCSAGAFDTLYDALVDVVEADDETCPEGGVVLLRGPDLDGNGTLSDDEIESRQPICDGADGGDALSSLIATAVEPPGENCATGGVRIEVGIDDGDGGEIAGDGVLGAGEVDSTSFVCTGLDGSDGADGLDGSNGANGADGLDGTNGADGAAGLDGADGLDGAAGASGCAAAPLGGGMHFGWLVVSLLMLRRRYLS